MGFAKLYFPNAGTIQIGNVIRDIVGVVTGAYTSTSQLLAATQALSEISNSAGRGDWTRVYPSTVTNTIPQVLSAPCLNGATKYVQISSLGYINYNNYQGVSSTTNTTPYRYAIDLNLSTGLGFCMRSITAATSATAVSNPSYLNTTTGGTPAQSSFAAWNSMNYFVGNTIWLSWSSRHLMIYGAQRGAAENHLYNAASACFEHNETGIHDFRNTAPFCHAQWFDNNAFVTAASPSVTDQYTERLDSSFYCMNHYNPSGAVATGAFNLLSNVTTANVNSVCSSISSFYPTAFTKTSAGANAVYLQPLFFHQHQVGIPHQYISDLCKVYRVQPGIGRAGDTLTVGASTYAYFPIWPGGAAATNTSMALAVLKA